MPGNAKNRVLQNRLADFHETWYVVFVTSASCSLNNDGPTMYIGKGETKMVFWKIVQPET